MDSINYGKDDPVAIEVLKNPPERPPALAERTWPITALCALFSFVLFLPAYAFVRKIFALAGLSEASYSDITLWISLSGSIIICTFPPIILGGRAASMYVLRLVKLYETSGNGTMAVKVANQLSYKVWFRHFKRDGWFQEFLRDNGLADRNARYRRFFERL
jgi:hypothetical protein